LFAVLIGAGMLALLLAAMYLLQRFASSGSGAAEAHTAPAQSGAPLAAAAASAPSPADGAEADADVETEFYRYAFGASHFDYQILGEHQAVLQEAVASIREVIHRQEYFPRRPLLIPQLLRAMHDEQTSRQKLAEILLQDPVLAGDVLKLANSSYYRLSSAPLESIERAIVVLGTQGLKSVVASSLLQPVFQRQKGYFENFSPAIWNYALLAGNAAAEHATKTRSCDRFSAHLLGLLSALGPLVLFRLTVDIYQRHPSILPRAEVFIRVIQAHGNLTTRRIGEDWELSEPFIQALEEQSDAAPASPLGQVLKQGHFTAMTAIVKGEGTDLAVL